MVHCTHHHHDDMHNAPRNQKHTHAPLSSQPRPSIADCCTPAHEPLRRLYPRVSNAGSITLNVAIPVHPHHFCNKRTCYAGWLTTNWCTNNRDLVRFCSILINFVRFCFIASPLSSQRSHAAKSLYYYTTLTDDFWLALQSRESYLQLHVYCPRIAISNGNLLTV